MIKEEWHQVRQKKRKRGGKQVNYPQGINSSIDL